MNNSVTYKVNLEVVGENIVGEITSKIKKMSQATENATKSFGDYFKTLLSLSKVADGLSILENKFDNLIEPGVKLNSNMTELSVITGVTGDALKSIENSARATAKVFGTDASENVESYKLILSQLDPAIAKNNKAMKMMGDNVNILSKQMGGDTVLATNILTASMNQFGVSTENPIEAAKVMGQMMNTMSATAQTGSVEIRQIQSALEKVGKVAKTTGLSFEETNAQIQILDKVGKKGSEGGVALRNVLTTLSEGRFVSKDAKKGLEAVGISIEHLGNVSVPLTDRLRTLRKIKGDTALISKVFGEENMESAIAMINSADSADVLTKQITGTKSATQKAEIAMGSYAEKLKLSKVWWDDLKIGFFNIIEPVALGAKQIFGFFNVAGQLVVSGNALVTAISALNLKLTYNTIKTKLASFWQGVLKVKAIALGVAQKTLGFIVALTGTIFGSTTSKQKLMAMWSGVLAVKTKVLAVAQGALNVVMSMNPIGLVIIAITALVVMVAIAINYFNSWGSTLLLFMGPIGLVVSGFIMIRRHWDSIVSAFKSDGIIEGLKRIGIVLLDTIMHPLQRILGWVAKITGWNWAKSAQNSVSEFRTKMELVTPDETVKTDKEPSKVEVVKNKFDLQNKVPKTPTLGGSAVKSIQSNNSVGGKTDNGNSKVSSLTIGKMMENFNIHMNTNGNNIDKTQLLNAVKEVLLTATQDFALATE